MKLVFGQFYSYLSDHFGVRSLSETVQNQSVIDDLS